ncbi:hypothetical protein AB0C07_15850 [Actinoplanes missouriensis]|uniref:hypothetical protein n=1 Tax=Actinoplanes missouriensis TaxID=1866 RepID=UPI0033FD5ECF
MAVLLVAVVSRSLPVLLLIAVCSAGWTLWCRAQLTRFRPGRTPLSPTDTRRLREIEHLQYGNTVIHGTSRCRDSRSTWRSPPPCCCPAPDAYRVVDRPGPAGVAAWLRAAGEGLARTPGVALRAPARLVRNLPGRRVRSGSGEQLTPGFDHGARLGVRELASPPGSSDLGSHPDVRKHQRLIEHRVLAAIRDFLAARGVEPSSELIGGRLTPVPQGV